MQLTLGPIPYFWTREQVFAFYRQAGDWPVDRVYLGETVCSKRRELNLDDWLTIAEDLHEQGKEVILSSLTLIEARSEAASLKTLCRAGLAVEANDYTAVAIAAEQGRSFVGGSPLNLYNRAAIDTLAVSGMTDWIPPLEMDAGQLGEILATRPPVRTELFAFGRMPLAWSARCFAARAHDRPKDDCGFVCRQFPDGLPIRTREGGDFLVINGIQTQSHHCLDLLPHRDEIRELGVDAVRLSPQSMHMDRVVQRWADALAESAPPRLDPDWLPAERADGYWRNRPGMEATEPA